MTTVRGRLDPFAVRYGDVRAGRGRVPGRGRRAGADGRLAGRRGGRGDAAAPARCTSTRGRADGCGARARRAATSLGVVSAEPRLRRGRDPVVRARPAGPTCHTGARSCFDDDTGAQLPAAAQATVPQGFAGSRRSGRPSMSVPGLRPAGSYTTPPARRGCRPAGTQGRRRGGRGAHGGQGRCRRGTRGDPSRDQGPLAGEMGDLLYHLLVLCAERGLPPSDVIAVLRARHV